MDSGALWQSLLKALVAAATGQPGNFDVFSPALKEAERAAMTALALRPSAAAAPVAGDVPDSDQQDSDQPDPASTDEQPGQDQEDPASRDGQPDRWRSLFE